MHGQFLNAILCVVHLASEHYFMFTRGGEEESAGWGGGCGLYIPATCMQIVQIGYKQTKRRQGVILKDDLFYLRSLNLKIGITMKRGR